MNRKGSKVEEELDAAWATSPWLAKQDLKMTCQLFILVSATHEGLVNTNQAPYAINRPVTTIIHTGIGEKKITYSRLKDIIEMDMIFALAGITRCWCQLCRGGPNTL